ncbi:MAG: hypothetical protein E7452_01335 [Ruminococcaceae bacterium]|nr:hypothetical protein [Oscillospiraceae bacterium]
MDQTYYFKNALWLGNKDGDQSTLTVLRGQFNAEKVKSATLRVLGLGFFKCYINGHCINPDTFLPLSSDYEPTPEPKDEVLSAHRIYVPEFEIGQFLVDGNNTIEIRFGGGWYCHWTHTYGQAKAIYYIAVETENGTVEFVSDETCTIKADVAYDYYFTEYEFIDLNIDDPWRPADVMDPLVTEYCSTDCPIDALIAETPVTEVGQGNEGRIFDCGENTTGYPVLRINAPKGECVRVLFSEDINADGTLDMRHYHDQKFHITSDGRGQIVQPTFTWFGFRYFEVIGDAEPLGVKVIHANVPVSSTFECDNETLNWTYRTFLHTMLCNMHTGHPSDCPHLERRGYTGDGQLTCHAVFSTLDAEKLYKKWLQDIADGQDVLSGHIQYTAPYIRSGGGPGGWGSAIVEVPYQIYRHFGDSSVLEKYYGNMRRYIDYLEAHTEFGLVTSDKPGEWCLGDWCGPNVLYPDRDITAHNQQVILPAPMVNTYFMVKSLQKMCEIARVIGKESDIEEYEEKITYRKNAIRAAYYNAFDYNFIMNVQGANAFALDIGLGVKNTYQNLVSYYQKLGCYDTGIFATDIVTRLLFENGDEDVAVSLLTNDGPQGYEHWRRNGATSFHEYWDSNRSRSHSHPMFGAPVAYFFEYLLGIRQAPGTAGYRTLVIEPKAVNRFGWMKGSMKIPAGIAAVAYEKAEGKVRFTVTVPDGVEAVFRFGGNETALVAGENVIEAAE